jgi:hypothetical protein
VELGSDRAGGPSFRDIAKGWESLFFADEVLALVSDQSDRKPLPKALKSNLSVRSRTRDSKERIAEQTKLIGTSVPTGTSAGA